MRDRITTAFEVLGRDLIRWRWLVVLTMVLISIALSSGLAQLEIVVSAERFLERDDPARHVYDEFRREFGNDETLIVHVRCDRVFGFDSLARLAALHADLEQEVPLIDEVQSLVNARQVRGEQDELIVEELLEHWPETDEALAAVEARALANALYRNVFLAEDGRSTALHLSLPTSGGAEDLYLTVDEMTPVLDAVDAIVARHQADDFQISRAGAIPTTVVISHLIEREMAKFTGITIGLVALLLLVMFRRASGVVLPVIVTVLPLGGTFGAMTLLGIEISSACQIVPSFLVAIGIAQAVHLLAIFYRRFDQGAERDEAIVYALAHSGLAIVMAGVTTAASLSSFLLADLATLKSLGTAAPIGVLLILAYTLFLLPALLALWPIRRKRHASNGESDRIDQWIGNALTAMGDFSTRFPWRVLAAWAIAITVGGIGASRLEFAHDPMLWFAEDAPTRLAAEHLSEDMRLGLTMEVLLETNEQDGIHDPDVMRRVDAIQRLVREAKGQIIEPGAAFSVANVLRETHRALNDDDPAFYVIPESEALIAQELLLFELGGSDDLLDLVDGDHSKARITVTLPTQDTLYYRTFVDGMAPEIQELAGESLDVTITGLVVLSARTMAALYSSMFKSYAFSFVVIAILMIALIGDVRLGLLSMIPNLSPIVLGLGLMHLLGAKLDLFMIPIGSVAIGIAVDDTIHFMHNFGRYYRQSGDARAAVHETLQWTGRAMLITSVALTLGFASFLGAELVGTADFGIITAFVVLVAFLADVTLAPAIVVLATSSQDRP